MGDFNPDVDVRICKAFHEAGCLLVHGAERYQEAGDVLLKELRILLDDSQRVLASFLRLECHNFMEVASPTHKFRTRGVSVLLNILGHLL